MWLVRIALTRPYTFLVLALLLLIIGILSIQRTPTDILPNIDIPVISVVWTYNGLAPDDMANYITGYFERALTTTVNDIEHIESTSLIGVSVIKIFFQPNAKVPTALSQVTAISQTLLRYFPPGTTPPLILIYNASTVPILQLVLSSSRLSEQRLNDLGNNFIRTQLATVQGAALPFPYGGKPRQIQVDLNQKAMQTYGVSPADINQAIDNQNLILPAGTQKIGQFEYLVKLNASPPKVAELNDLPIRVRNGSVLFVHDVAHVRDGYAPQINIVRVNGVRAVMMSVEKTGNASTLDIINKVKATLPRIIASMPAALHISLFGDQSIFVKAAIEGVITEGIIAAMLTGLMILLFLGSWRSTLIIVISIPLSALAAIITLSALGNTINIMTLGGLALAVGILVDDATVAIENINWNLEQGKEVQTAILDGAHQIAIPALVSTLAICIVFVPMFFLSGVAHYLFIPLAEAVVFAMLASYFLSRTLVPTLANYWLRKKEAKQNNSHNWFKRFNYAFEDRFNRLREHYHNLLIKVLYNSKIFIILFILFLMFSFLILTPWLGSDFFPTVDAGQIKLHVRAPVGTRVEETARLAGQIDHAIKKLIPASDLDSIVDNVGLPVSGINLSYTNSGPIGPEDADILVSLKEGHASTFEYIKKLRAYLLQNFPSNTFSFLPADIVNQILNFGLPSPIDIQVVGLKKAANLNYTFKLLNVIKHIPGIVDARIQQSYNYPELFVNANRSLARELGFTQFDIATSMLISLSGSFQVAPTFWLDRENGVSYPLVSQTPQYVLNSLQALSNIPITSLNNSARTFQILGAVGSIKRTFSSAVESHYNVQPVFDIYASIQDRDLGSVSKDINEIINNTKSELPKGSFVQARGQMQTQNQSFRGLYGGLIFSIVLVYLLIVVNFQSWLDPLIIICALPASIAGIIWMLFLTHTTVSVPALTGAIMCMGVATANSILVISFARQNLKAGQDVFSAVIEACINRLRPVMMTALAMIIGMLPMSLSLGAGGEQNAPLGRAVIGGLIFATVATLFFVPSIFYRIYVWREKKNSKVLRGK